MSTAAAGGATPPARPRLALMTTLLVQAGATLAMNVPAVVAPVVAPALGVPAQRVGWFVGLAYFAAMVSGLVLGTRMQRDGPIRMSLAALLAAAAGLVAAGAAFCAPTWLWLWPAAALLIGAGYGVPNPAASMVLAAHAPPERRGLFFSIKQTGVPIGVGLAGLVVPPLVGALPWSGAMAALGATCLALALALRPTMVLEARVPRGRIETGPTSGAALLRATLAPLGRVWAEPTLRRLGVASLAFSMTQLCFTTFLVSYLKLELGRSLATAAAVLAGAQLVAVGCRVLWGQVADRWVSPLRLLSLLGLAMAGSAALLGALPTDASAALTMTAALACAATSMAWNGVYFAELAHRVRAEELGAVTGGTQFLTFCGAMVGPPVFASLVGVTGGHGPAYIVMALAPAAVGLWLWRASGGR
jgi:MFS family permease